MTPRIVAVDQFAGAGGWSHAARRIGILEYGVEIMAAAIRTRSANGFRTIYRDVWAGLFHPWLVPDHRLQIGSPPCQTFSMSGGGAGRDALADVFEAIDDGRWKDPARLFALGEVLDPRTALVLTPLAHTWAHRPALIALEQVPPVLPVWQAIAGVLRTLGYSVWTGILSSEMYGVPQTRARAILLARLDGVAEPPTPTHSRYYSREPKRFDPGVQKWVSMAEALGWGDAPDLLVETGQNSVISRTGETERYTKSVNVPAPTITGQARSWVYRNGTRERAARRPLDEPASTIFFGQSANEVVWTYERPATTIAGDSRVWPPGHKVNADDIARDPEAREKYGDRAGSAAIRVTVQQAATLQSFPTDHVWVGNKSKKFLQIGNAVPPLMGEAILGALLETPRERDPWEQVFAEVAG